MTVRAKRIIVSIGGWMGIIGGLVVIYLAVLHADVPWYSPDERKLKREATIIFIAGGGLSVCAALAAFLVDQRLKAKKSN